MKHRIYLAGPMMVAAILCTSCKQGPSPASAEQAAPQVGVIQMHPQQVTDSIQLDGQVAPSKSVNLVARVSGYLQSAPFTEGAKVEQGQVLFVIEPEPYRQQVKRNQAILDQIRAESKRQQVLLQQNATSQSSVENATSEMLQAEANLKLAQINLDYATVRAPFDGVIGKRTLDVGNYVGATAGGTVLATLQQLQPAYVNFSINERDLLRLRAKYPDARPKSKPIPVMAALQGEQQPSEQGMLDFVDSSLASGTGALALRTTFANKNLHLLPGMYARVVIKLGEPRTAMLVPCAATQTDQAGASVYVVDKESRAQRQYVKLGERFDQDCEVVSGLEAGQSVIVQGLTSIGAAQRVDAKPVQPSKS